jgi:hypothetical protein
MFLIDKFDDYFLTQKALTHIMADYYLSMWLEIFGFKIRFFFL